MRAQAYIAFVCALGLACLLRANWEMEHPIRFGCYLLICVLASALKVNLPGVPGTMSVNFLFILIGILELGAGQTMLMGCLGALAQCVWRPRSEIRPVQAVFSVLNSAVAVFAAWYTYHLPFAQEINQVTPALLITGTLVYFMLNTTGIAGVIALTENRPAVETWRKGYFWSFPFYLLGASIAWLSSLVNENGRSQSMLLLFPLIYVIYRSYRMSMGRLEDEKKHVEEMAALHLRTIEALALAIDAKDRTTHEHLGRVRTYALEIGQEMHLPTPELEALRAAALLHDIGKLAVPEHIISKPGKLTPQEFDKMKIPPVVGAEILDRVAFPYPVVPIVRSHHEKWDGSGYPDGLRAEEIPIGARILSAVDYLDALASDRQYRRALPLEQAMAEVAKLAGKSFDPAVVALLQRRHVELERKATTQSMPLARLSTDLIVERGDAPDAGFEVSDPAPGVPKEFKFLDSIVAGRLEAQLIFELTQDLGNSLSLDETLSVVATRLKRLVTFDAIAVYLCREGRLHPEYVSGEGSRFLSSLEIPIGQGLSGWVAQTGRTVLNANPAVESAYLDDPAKHTTLRSAVAVPLIGANGTLGVLTLYQADHDAFSADHLRILQAISPKISLTMENAMKYRLAETRATTDFLTELPNARSLFQRLDSELARCKRTNEKLTVLVCDLDEFKVVNDRFGHLVGNRVLRAVGSALRASCREYDYVARMGGDEFVLVLPASDGDGMKRRIGELRRIGAMAGSAVTGMNDMTISVGGAFYPADGSDAEQLLAEADRRMYQAKRAVKLKAPPDHFTPHVPAGMTIQ